MHVVTLRLTTLIETLVNQTLQYKMCSHDSHKTKIMHRHKDIIMQRLCEITFNVDQYS